MKTMIKIAAVMVAGAVLAGCTDGPMGDYEGTKRGVEMKVDGGLWGGGGAVIGRSTTYQKATELPLGTLHVQEDTMSMTGPGVEIWARMMFCDKAPYAEECGGGNAR